MHCFLLFFLLLFLLSFRLAWSDACRFATFVRSLPEWRDPEPFDNHAIIVCSSCLGFENGLPALTIRLIVHTVGVRRTVSYETSETIRLDLDDQQSSLDLIAAYAFSIIFLIFNSLIVGMGRAPVLGPPAYAA